MVNINFGGFREAVNELGCAYIDVDRRYFNDNSGYGPDYATIDLKQGYQKVCGQDALDYVRYRHEDTDIVRAARQQEFLRQLKQQIGITKLFERRHDLLEIFGKYTDSDIRGRANVLRLLKLALASAQHPVREIHFKGSIGVSYVTAELGGHEGPARGLPRPEGDARPARAPQGRQEGQEGARARASRTPRSPARTRRCSSSTRARSSRPSSRSCARTAALYAGPPRYYKIPVGKKGERKWYPSYRMVIKKGLIGEYYGIQGTTWKDPPVLRDASETREIGGRKYELHYDGDRLRMVAWRTNAASTGSRTRCSRR